MPPRNRTASPSRASDRTYRGDDFVHSQPPLRSPRNSEDRDGGHRHGRHCNHQGQDHYHHHHGTPCCNMGVRVACNSHHHHPPPSVITPTLPHNGRRAHTNPNDRQMTYCSHHNQPPHYHHPPPPPPHALVRNPPAYTTPLETTIFSSHRFLHLHLNPGPLGSLQLRHASATRENPDLKRPLIILHPGDNYILLLSRIAHAVKSLNPPAYGISADLPPATWEGWGIKLYLPNGGARMFKDVWEETGGVWRHLEVRLVPPGWLVDSTIWCVNSSEELTWLEGERWDEEVEMWGRFEGVKGVREAEAEERERLRLKKEEEERAKVLEREEREDNRLALEEGRRLDRRRRMLMDG